MAEGSPFAAYVAQAIASRTYAYHFSNGGATTINNSGENYQVYMPFRYEGLGLGYDEGTKAIRKNTVDQAITWPGALYMTLPYNDEPIKAFFGADNCTFTEDNPAEDYLESVYDPISAKPDPCSNADIDNGTSNGGMGSAGASRWGHGNTSRYGTGNPWRIRWQSGLQSLTHYYTGVHIRDVGENIVTPEYRWNPLDVYWTGTGTALPPPMTPGNSYAINILVQNTGTVSWTGTNNQFAYQWQDGSTVISQGTGLRLYTILPGQSVGPQQVLSVQAPAVPGRYTLLIDMQAQDGVSPELFYSREPGRPWYPLEYTCDIGNGGQCYFGKRLYLPIVLKDAVQ